jgi:hypothetical protein
MPVEISSLGYLSWQSVGRASGKAMGTLALRRSKGAGEDILA